jgi:hypothetical protein
MNTIQTHDYDYEITKRKQIIAVIGKSSIQVHTIRLRAIHVIIPAIIYFVCKRIVTAGDHTFDSHYNIVHQL